MNTISQGYSFLDLLYVMCHAVFAHELIRLCGSMSACAEHCHLSNSRTRTVRSLLDETLTPCMSGE